MIDEREGRGPPGEGGEGSGAEPAMAELVIERVPGLALVVLPDPEAQVERERGLLGRPLASRLAAAAVAAGFDRVLVAPGVAAPPEHAEEVATYDPVGGPALLVYDTAHLDTRLLDLMVRHPLDADEQFTLYDGAGRPTALFSGHLAVVPDHMPVLEELDLPEGLGPETLGRWVFEEDGPRIEALILRHHGAEAWTRSRWGRRVMIPALRLLCQVPGPVARIEAGALLAAAAAGLASVIPAWVGPVLGACLLVLVAVLHRAVEPLRHVLELDAPPDALGRAARPLAHAAVIVGLTYRLVADAERPDLAGLLLLVVGIGAAALPLARAREHLRGQTPGAFGLPTADAWLERLGVHLPDRWRGVPWLEVACLLTALSGIPELPWMLLVAASLARLWRWFVGTARADGPRRGSAGPGERSGDESMELEPRQPPAAST